MLPTIPRSDSRSKNSSETRPSSSRATIVSWGVVLTIKSLVMEGPFHEPRPRGPARRVGRRAAERGPDRARWRAPTCARRTIGDAGGEARGVRLFGLYLDGKKLQECGRVGASVGEAPHPDVENEADAD